MTDLTRHEAHALCNLTDRAVWLALVDHHEEALNVTHAVAVRAVATMRRKARREEEWAKAREAVAPGSVHAKGICDAVRAYCGDEVAWMASVLVVPGRSRPRLHTPTVMTNPPTQGSCAITVGSRFVLKLHKIAREVLNMEIEAGCGFIEHLFTA